MMLTGTQQTERRGTETAKGQAGGGTLRWGDVWEGVSKAARWT